MRFRSFLILMVSFSILAPGLWGSLAFALRDSGSSLVSVADSNSEQSEQKDHCHESESLPQPDQDCHCAKHRVSCCHVNLYVLRTECSSLASGLTKLPYMESFSFSWPAPDLEGPFQPPRA